MAPPALPEPYSPDSAFNQTPPPYRDLTPALLNSPLAPKSSPVLQREISPELIYYSASPSFKFKPINRQESTASSSTLSPPPSPISSACQKPAKTRESMPLRVRAADMSATDFKVVLGFHAANKQAYQIIRNHVTVYAIQHGITSVDTPGPDAWGLCKEHAIAHKYLARFRAAFNGSGPEE